MYEEYMQNLLGMQINPYRNTYQQLNNSMQEYYTEMDDNMQFGLRQQMPYRRINNDTNLEELYPEIYKIIYPMVKKACVNNTRPVTKELIDEITQEIYSNVETDNIINVNINLGESINSRGEKQKEQAIINKEESQQIENNQEEGIQTENRQVENRQINNDLNDLIKILILREFLGRQNGERIIPPRHIPQRANSPIRWN